MGREGSSVGEGDSSCRSRICFAEGILAASLEIAGGAAADVLREYVLVGVDFANGDEAGTSLGASALPADRFRLATADAWDSAVLTGAGSGAGVDCPPSLDGGAFGRTLIKAGDARAGCAQGGAIGERKRATERWATPALT
jgi:hypothetical protein